uniref:BTB domain-containing protein n=1 Tax=Oryza meridionalis TaxID=40149 RepID=A0A0E0DJM6_9ORYZ
MARFAGLPSRWLSAQVHHVARSVPRHLAAGVMDVELRLVAVVSAVSDARAFEALLRFIYTDAPPKLDEEDDDFSSMAWLLVAADRYNVERLKMIYENELCKRIDGNNFEAMLALAE